MPTPVQRKSIPVVLSGSDTVVMARTGSGKTAAFCIPLLERYLSSSRRSQSQSSSKPNQSAYAVILSPTRELSLQTLRVLQNLSTYIQNPSLNCIGIHGGESMERQFTLLSSHPDVIVATPGRLAHHISEIPDFHLRQCDVLIFDEADRLFEMGFSSQIRQICASMPSVDEGRQTLLFSATMPKVLMEFTKSGIMEATPQVVRLEKDASVSEELRIGFVTVRSQEKDAVLLHLLRDVVSQVPDMGLEDRKKTRAPKLKSKGKKKAKKTESAKSTKEIQEKDKDMTKEPVSKLGLTLIFAATRHHVDYLTTLINNAGLGSQTTGGDGANSPIATCIYGTMDQEARKLNLYNFRSGITPILVVTDVAARGIDVPLIDHVIHYSFPPSAKLFVHRSGRAARAGRIGYCWGLVDVEEMAYMVDLYLFLGRKLLTGHEKDEKEEDDNNQDENDTPDVTGKNQGDSHDTVPNERIYTLKEMTPEMVHYGSVPESTITEEIENVRRIIDSELTGSHDAETLRSLIRVCNNAMKQYRRSRPEASKQGSRRAKAILEGTKDITGKRVGGGMIPPHPILRGVEMEKIINKHGQGQEGSLETPKQKLEDKLKEMKKREIFLRAMSNFRPKETIFESFATAGAKSNGVVSHIDKGRTVNNAGSKKIDSSAAFTAMKNMRRQMKLAHDKGTSLVVAGSETALLLNGESQGEHGQDMTVDQGNIASVSSDDGKSNHSTASTAQTRMSIPDKRRLSKAERRKMKKAGATKPNLDSDLGTYKKAKQNRGTDFRDPNFYIDNDVNRNTEESQRSRHIEAAMQPSASAGKDDMASALRLEEAMLDIVGDENADLVQRQRMVRWDKSKRKYIQTTLGQELSGDSKSKKLRLESGQLMKSDKVKLGELYEKWQKKNNKSVGRSGVFDDEDDPNINDSEALSSGRTKKSPKSNKSTNDSGLGLKSEADIKKKRAYDKKMKLKNMKKSDRSRLETHRRQQRNEKIAKAAAAGKGWQGKKGFSGRHKKH